MAQPLSPSHLLPILLPYASQQLLNSLVRVNRNTNNLAAQFINRRLDFQTLLSVDRFNTQNLAYTRHITLGIRAATALTDSHPFIKALTNETYPNLTFLNLQDARNLSDHIISRILTAQISLQNIRLPPQAGNEAVISLMSRPETAKSLTHLALRSSMHLNSDLLVRLATRHAKLQYLDVALTKPLLSLQSVMESCAGLKHLDMRFVGGEHDLHHYLDNPDYAPELEFIAFAKVFRELSSERYISQLILNKSTSLKEIVIYNDDTLTTSQVQRLVEHCPKLIKMTLHRCKHITGTQIQQQNLLNWGATTRQVIASGQIYREEDDK